MTAAALLKDEDTIEGFYLMSKDRQVRVWEDGADLFVEAGPDHEIDDIQRAHRMVTARGWVQVPEHEEEPFITDEGGLRIRHRQIS